MILNFSKKFYDLRAIKNACRAYNKLAKFKIEINKKAIKVILTNIDEETKNIIEDEFSNYILAEMKNE